MRRIGLPLLLFFLLQPARLSSPRELYSIGESRNAPDGKMVLFRYRAGAWEEEAFPPADGGGGCFSPALAVSPGGELWAAWAARGEDRPKIYFSRRREGGWTEPLRVTAEDGCWEMTPAIAFGPDGTLLAAWSGERDGSSAIYCARWGDGGFGRAEMVSSPGRSPVLHPALAVAPEGRAFLAWQEWDGEHYRVFSSLRRGGRWSAAEPLAGRSAGDETFPSVFALEGRNWECSWVERGRLVSATGEPGRFSDPVPAEHPAPGCPAAGGEPPVAGWVVERDPAGATRTRRTGVVFEADGGSRFREEKTAIGNRVFIGYGDSITWGTYEKGWCYIPLLESSLQTAHSADYTLYNHGYPGATTADLLSGPGHPDWPCPGISDVIAGSDASRILIMAGTNDVRNLISPATSQTHLGAMVDRARAAGCEPVLATVIPVYKNWPDRYNRTEILNRDYILPLARAKNCLLADPFQAYLDYGQWEDLLIDDGIHPVWEAGSRVIADAWFSALYAPPRLDSGDYDGDRTSDIAVFRPAAGLWALRALTRVYFGTAADIPASGDYNADGTADIAVFRESAGLWAVRGVTKVYFGRAGDIPVPGDYDGDGSCQAAVFRPDAGLWAVRGWTRCYFGGAGDLVVPGYYRGDRRKEIAVFRPASGLWAVRGWSRFHFGQNADQPAPADFAGDGTERAAIFREGNGYWAVRGVTRAYFGREGDTPAPGDFQGGGIAEIAIFRKSGGLWSVRAGSRVYFGQSGDVPVTGRVTDP